MEEKLRQLIENAPAILVTSHISPDADAISSSLLLAETLRTNYPDKLIELVLEEPPDQDFSFLKGYDKLRYGSILDGLQTLRPSLLIIVDANNFQRVSRQQGAGIKQLVAEKGIRTAVIDHHEPADKEESEVYINNQYAAAALEVYILCFEKLGLRKPEGSADTAMLGIIGDTRRFKYYDPGHRQTFKVVSDLIDEGASIEELENRLSRYTKDQLLVITELINKTVITGEGYNYSFVGDDFGASWQNSGKSLSDYKSGFDVFINQFVRNIGNNFWGFVLYPDLVSGTGNYSVSFRALHGSADVAVIARSLGGGGHKSAAGAKLQAGSVEEALQKVESAIRQYSTGV